MKARDADSRTKPSANARAEAAAWIARLHGPARDSRVEEACRQWLADDPQNAAAFEFLTDTWEKAGQLRREPVQPAPSRRPSGIRLSLPRAVFASCIVALIAVATTLYFLRSEGVSTAVGEQRTWVLPDGTRVYLNTNSRAVVRFDRKARRVDLEKGEALFEVAQDRALPFVVSAGGREVTALGTSFIVRRDPRLLSVTLVEGKVRVSADSARDRLQANVNAQDRPGSAEPTRDAPNLGNAPTSGDAVTLAPGQRAIFATGQPPRFDRPALEKVTAWEHGQVSFDDTTLADAVSEMNRYNRLHLVIPDPQVAAIRVSGLFRAGDIDYFLQALARMHHLRALREGSEVVLSAPLTATPENGPAEKNSLSE